jgi:regulatory protein
MIITKIERQKKNRSRMSVFVDDLYAFSVSEDTYARFILHTGQTLTEEERTEIERTENESSVKKTALKFRSYRPRSRKEISEYLQKKGFEESDIAIGITFLTDNNLINDEEFARMLCRDRLMLKPIGRSSMRQLLYKKGIDRNLTERILDEQYTSESEKALALKEAERKFKRVSSLPPLTQKKRIFEHLVRRGYDSSLSMNIVSQLVKS